MLLRWRGLLAISNRPRERSFAEHELRMGWRGFPLLQSRSLPLAEELPLTEELPLAEELR